MCLIKHHTMKTCWESGGAAPHILNLSTRWRLVVSFMSWLLYHCYPCDRRLCGPQSQAVYGGKKKIPCHCQKMNLGCPACSLVSILFELSLFSDVSCAQAQIRQEHNIELSRIFTLCKAAGMNFASHVVPYSSYNSRKFVMSRKQKSYLKAVFPNFIPGI
jgi:hypothetical protein